MTSELDGLPKIAAPAARALHGAGYTTVRQLANLPRAELAALHGMGPKALEIIQAALAEHGLDLAHDPTGSASESAAVADPIADFVEAKILPPYRPIFAAFRELVRKDFPQLTETMRGGTDAYPGVPVYRLNRIVVTVSPTQNGITFSFTDGALFHDEPGILEGAGHKTKNVRLRTLEQFDAEIFRYYLRQAIAHDTD